MHIREMRTSDISAVESICLQTAAPQLRKNETACENTLLLYNRYYTRAELAHCFVAADENDTAVGYILCAPDFSRYRKGFSACEVKQVRKLGLLRGLRAKAEYKLQQPFQKAYPAHLHIDLLPGYQHMGLGTQLMDRLKAHLREHGISGVCLCVAKNNTGAVRFYQKHGFCILQNLGGALFMGCRL